MKSKTYIQQVFLAFAAFAAITAVSCTEQPSEGLESYIARRDSLRIVKDNVEAEIAKLESIIVELDTTAERKLVTTFKPQRTAFRHYFEVYGNVESDQAATLYAETPGLVQQILVSEGQRVRKGEVLIKLDNEIVSRNVAELRTSLDLATTLYEKQKRLWDQQIGSEVQFLEAKNRKESLENSISTLQEQMNKSTIRAPFDGVVDKIYPKIGEMASGQSPALRIVNVQRLYITAQISERYVGKVAAGDKVWAIVNRTDTVHSVIERVGTFINPNNRTFEIRITLDQGLSGVMPNSLVVLKINDFTLEDAIAIPSSLIMQDGDGSDYIFTAEVNGNNRLTARKRRIDSGMSYMGQTLIRNGIDAEVPIIDKGSRSVRDGDWIEDVNI